MAHPNCTMSANAIKCLPQTLNDLTKYASARCMVVDYVVAFNPCLLQMNFASQNETVPLPFSAAFTSECCCTDKMYISICFKHTKWKYKTDTYMRKTGSPFGWITNNAAMWQPRHQLRYHLSAAYYIVRALGAPSNKAAATRDKHSNIVLQFVRHSAVTHADIWWHHAASKEANLRLVILVACCLKEDLFRFFAPMIRIT